MKEEDYRVENITHALIVLDPETEKDGNVDIVHFCGYWSEPTESDAEHLLEELKTDEEFGLTDIADRLIIVEAPQEIIDYYKNG